MCIVCLKLAIKTPGRRQCRLLRVFIVNIKHISGFFLVFLLLTLTMYLFAGKFPG